MNLSRLDQITFHFKGDKQQESRTLICKKVILSPNSDKKKENTPCGYVLFSYIKAMIGFEPMKDGFADRCLRPLGHIAM